MTEKQPDISPIRDEASIHEGHTATEKQMRDIGADLYLEVHQYSREELDAERATVLRKIDGVIMPMVPSPFPSLHTTPYTSSDLHNLHNPIPRQALPKLRKRLHPNTRPLALRSALLLGRRDLQLRLPILGASRKLPYPAPPCREIHRRHDPPVVAATHVPRRSEKLRWHASSEISARHVRSQHFPRDNEHREYVLHALGATVTDVHIPRIQRHGDDGRRATWVRSWIRSLACCENVAVDFPRHRMFEFRVGVGVPVGNAG
jgi:hypothetical protein